jgi:hypothetical protein
MEEKTLLLENECTTMLVVTVTPKYNEANKDCNDTS